MNEQNGEKKRRFLPAEIRIGLGGAVIILFAVFAIVLGSYDFRDAKQEQLELENRNLTTVIQSAQQIILGITFPPNHPTAVNFQRLGFRVTYQQPQLPAVPQLPQETQDETPEDE